MGTQALNTLWGPLCRSSAGSGRLGAEGPPTQACGQVDHVRQRRLALFVAPFRRLGGELGGGVIVPASHVFLGLRRRNCCCAGADVPNDTTVLAFK